MQLTERDLEMIRWINGHRMATVEQVVQAFDMGKKAAYRRLRAMVEAGYVEHQRIFRDKPGVYFPTSQGIAVSGDDLPAITRITLGTYEHDLQLVDLSIRLVEQTGGQWHPERRIRREKGFLGVGIPGHVPDGLLRLPSGSTVAIELELSVKGNRRIKDILMNYQKGEHGAVSEVWYYCRSAAIAQRVRKHAPQLVKTYAWPELTPFAEGFQEEAGATQQNPGAWLWGTQKGD